MSHSPRKGLALRLSVIPAAFDASPPAHALTPDDFGRREADKLRAALAAERERIASGKKLAHGRGRPYGSLEEALAHHDSLIAGIAPEHFFHDHAQALKESARNGGGSPFVTPPGGPDGRPGVIAADRLAHADYEYAVLKNADGSYSPHARLAGDPSSRWRPAANGGSHPDYDSACRALGSCGALTSRAQVHDRVVAQSLMEARKSCEGQCH